MQRITCPKLKIYPSACKAWMLLIWVSFACTYFLGLLLPIVGLAQQTESSIPYLTASDIIDSTRLHQPIRNRERGLPYIQNYTPEDYRAGGDNGTIAQNENGLIYIANRQGVLEYDGVKWRLIQLPDLGIVHSLAVDQNNRVYVGGYNDLGYLAPDSLGQVKFVSLRSKLDPVIDNFLDVRSTHVKNNAVYFRTFNYLMRWKNKKFTVWTPHTRFWFSTFIGDDLYISDGKKSLKKIIGDTLVTVLSREDLNGKIIMGLEPYSPGQLLVITLHDGLFLLEGNSLIRFFSKVNTHITEHTLYGYKLQSLPNGWYSIATLSGGIVVINHEGKVIDLLNEDSGLTHNSIRYQFVDEQNGLWIATYNGISRVEIATPYTIFDFRRRVEAVVNDILRYRGKLYISTLNGIFYLIKDNEWFVKSVFKHFDDGPSDPTDLLTADGSLFAASISGVYQIVENEVVNRFPYPARSLYYSVINPNRIYIGLNDGLAFLKKINGEWIEGGDIEGIEGEISNIVEDKNGNLWLESPDGIWLVDFKAGKDGKQYYPLLNHFRVNIKLPEGSPHLFRIDGEPVFEISGKLYSYNSELDSIMVDKRLINLFEVPGKIYPKFEDDDGNIWMFVQFNPESQQLSRAVALKKPDGTFQIKRIKDRRITQNVSAVMYPEDNGIIWYGGQDGLIRHNLNVTYRTNKEYNALIRQVTLNGDSLIYGGGGTLGHEVLLNYNSNNLRFEFAAPSFTHETATKYQFILVGFDEGWSNWTSETQKDYTNIPFGTYHFKVRAKNIYDNISNAAVFTFEVLRPWYRTWWAYILYLLGVFGLMAGMVKWRFRHLESEKEALENLVAERTFVVEQQAAELKTLDDAKSRFFTNITHEFRTPLTLILGEITQLKKNKLPLTARRPIYQIMERNGKQLLTLVNQLLDISTIEAGTMKLKAVNTDLIAFLKPIAAAYDSLAESKNTSFTFEHSEEHIPVYIDTDKMQKVIHNLLSNAFKFTDVNGIIKLRVVANHNGETEYARIEIEDNGPGIDYEKQQHIFDRFYQADDTATRQQEGTGIGLALAKELTELHGGEIGLESIPGKGCIFTVSFPIGKNYPPDNEIVERPMAVDGTEKETNLADYGLQPQPENDSRVKEPRKQNVDKPCILVVEDNADMQTFICEIIASKYRFAKASNGLEGWDKAVEEIPDLIISDVMMPKMDGLSLCRKIKKDERTSHIPIVLLTAKAGKESKMEGLETQADDYITKPFDADELLVLLHNRIEQRKKLRERFSKEVTLQPKDIAITSADEQFLQNAMEIVETNMADFDFTVETFVEQMNLGHTQVNRKLKALTDLTPVQFIRFIRLKRAAQKIAKEEDTISQIAYSVGFNNLSYFSKSFRKQFGQNPSEYENDDPMS